MRTESRLENAPASSLSPQRNDPFVALGAAHYHHAEFLAVAEHAEAVHEERAGVVEGFDELLIAGARRLLVAEPGVVDRPLLKEFSANFLVAP